MANIFKKGWEFVANALKEKQELKKAIQPNGEFSESLHQYGWILSQYADGATTEELTNTVPGEVVSFMNYIKKSNLSLAEAVSIYDYTVDSSNIIKASKYKEEWANLKYLDAFKKSVGNIRLPETDKVYLLHKVSDFLQNYDYAGKSQKLACYEFIDFCAENKLPVLMGVEYMVNEIYRVNRTYQHSLYLSDILSRNEIKEDHVYYRGINSSFLNLTPGKEIEELVGKEIINDFPTSTSHSFSGCFKGQGIDLILEINARKGTKGLDISNLSAFAEREMETLFAKNELYITGVRKEMVNGKERLIATCEMTQLELLAESQKAEKEGSSPIKCDLDYEKGYATITKEGLVSTLPIIDRDKFLKDMEVSYKMPTYIAPEPKEEDAEPTKDTETDLMQW